MSSNARASSAANGKDKENPGAAAKSGAGGGKGSELHAMICDLHAQVCRGIYPVNMRARGC
jgi:hypothetical protein